MSGVIKMDSWKSGVTKNDIPLSHLDYQYIEKCENGKELEKILKALRSGKEGRYPQLEECAEKKLEQLNPMSKVLWKDKPASKGSDIPADEWSTITDDLQNWEKDMSTRDQKFDNADLQENSTETLPPVRGVAHSIPVEQNSEAHTKQNKRATPRDYKEWDKVDIDAEMAKVDGEKVKPKPTKSAPATPIPAHVDTSALTDDEKNVRAEREKDKGNEAFRSADYEEAILYYTRSISITDSVAALNNRAQAYIKQEKWNRAFNDCDSVLKVEPSNLKALLRRGVALKGQKNFTKAKEDFSKVVAQEPNNKRAQTLLEEVTDLLQEQKKKGRRMVIEEVDGSDKEEEDEACANNDADDEKSPSAQMNGHVGGMLGEDAPKHPPSSPTKTKPHTQETPPLIQHLDLPKTNTSSKLDSSKQEGSPKVPPSRKPMHAEEQVKTSSSKLSPSKGVHVKKSGDGQPDPVSPKKEDPTPELCPPILPPGPPPALPAAALALKHQGNELFKRGQYGNAIGAYDKAAEMIINDASQGPNLSVLLSNRASCKHKIGDCRGCVHDCTAALQLTPDASKALLRRAVAYEALEKLGEAYVDYRQVLNLDSNALLAQQGATRCGQQLQNEKGIRWREQLPNPVPHTAPILPNPVPHTAPILPQCPPSRPIPTRPAPSQPSSAKNQKGASSEEMFEKYKKLGNDLVQKGRHTDAIKCYTQCIENCPSQVAPYTNRALCHLKLEQPEKVGEDCGVALTLDPGNVKALYRRALAYKQMGEYSAAITDLNHLLRLDSKNISAKRDLTAITELLKEEEMKAAASKPRQRMKIEEVYSSSDEENDAAETSSSFPAATKVSSSSPHKSQSGPSSDSQVKPSPTSSTTSGRPDPPTQPVKPCKSPINQSTRKATPYEFIHSWTALKGVSDIEQYVKLLHQVEPSQIPKVFSNKLDGDMLQKIIECISHTAQKGDVKQACAYLNQLPKVKRFSTVAMFLASSDRQVLSTLLDQLKEVDGGLSKDECSQLRSQFGLS